LRRGGQPAAILREAAAANGGPRALEHAKVLAAAGRVGHCERRFGVAADQVENATDSVHTSSDGCSAVARKAAGSYWRRMGN
jgi:hypothetical protein